MTSNYETRRMAAELGRWMGQAFSDPPTVVGPSALNALSAIMLRRVRMWFFPARQAMRRFSNWWRKARPTW